MNESFTIQSNNSATISKTETVAFLLSETR
uniref:Uncharacterized protein n=1 Tax=Siphoviridae sp. ctd9R8 TaxID=2825576 RepID=A0A8S5PVT8_9CAUD|nr:MAG TPA: hypothetical protein [Siphoviridae sp. ctd9R8]